MFPNYFEEHSCVGYPKYKKQQKSEVTKNTNRTIKKDD
jgi:hypothetical protein